ncbi:PH domain-containing protein [Nocardioides sp. dk4132]|uniref:PH domain-containing protein n=1 Tax=unclassified Nocardioides TaxID=2615069 RepID=UPI00129635E5|nr:MULTISPECIES: PH domain-containing protein [unclassified Nocardioides]MQW75900.1 PH domain-containing protein [Nocardioides sp. dk4132]QGA08761.1 PH domain-containing protein [Nocardioides sp. dk884]
MNGETDGWQRLDRRMLLVNPLQELVKFLPALLGLLVAGTAIGGRGWQLLAVAVPVLLGVVRYLTTRFRVAEGRVELRRGLLNRRTLAVPVDRVRTVDLTAGPVHRLLGLVTVRIGTGTASSREEDALDLDGLPGATARTLRAALLRARDPLPGGTDGVPGPAPTAHTVLRLDPAWARYAPLTGTGLVLLAGVVGGAFQLATTLGLELSLRAEDLPGTDLPVAGWLAVVAGLVVVLLVVSALAVAAYLLTSWGLVLTHRPGAWHLVRGLLTTRETTLDDDRVAGVVLHEPAGLRLAGAAHLSAIVTGLDRSRPGSATLVPPAPTAVAAGVGGEVVGTSAPLSAPLVAHGPAATRRRWSRALGPAALVAGLGVVAWLALPVGRWGLTLAVLALPVAAVLAHDRSRALGHALVEGHLVARSGSLTRAREVLATRHVIGWTFRDTVIQRRAGLLTLTATTAGGDQQVTVPDVPRGRAVHLADDAVPGLLHQFLAP